MNLIISIKPEFVSKIISGEKKYEFRRLIYRKEVDKIYIYQTLPHAGIIGYFNPGEIIKSTPSDLWNSLNDVSGTSEEFFNSYFHDKSEGYAIEIKNLVVFDNPITDSGIRAPQSYKYIDYDLKP
jgi:type I restriction enzyme S subunit